MRQITGKNNETVDFNEPITIKQWLEWFINKYEEALTNIYKEVTAEKLFSSTTLFVNGQAIFNIHDILCKDLNLNFFSTVSGG